MTRTQLAAALDAAEALEANARGQIARLHNRPLGGVLEPKHKNDALRDAFHAGHAEAAKLFVEA